MDILEFPVVIEIAFWILFSVPLILIFLRWRRKKESRENSIPPASAPQPSLVTQSRIGEGDEGGVRRRRLAPSDDGPSIAESHRASGPLKPSENSSTESQSPFNALLVFQCAGIIFASYVATVVSLVLLYRWQENAFLYSGAIPCSNTSQLFENSKDVSCDYHLGKHKLTTDVFLPLDKSPESPVIHLWWIHASRNPSSTIPRRLTVIMTHGNVDNVASYKEIYSWLSDLGLDVVAWDYPGFGKSSGFSEEWIINGAAEAVMRHVTEERRVLVEDIVLWGYSLGGPVVAHLAEKFPSVAGVILQAPLDSAADVLRAALPLTGWAVPLLSTQPYDTKSKMASMRTCLLLFVGTEDEQFSVERESLVFDKAINVDHGCSRFLKVDGLGHLEDPLKSAAFKREAENFLELVARKNL